MKEKFEFRRLTGSINVALKTKGRPTRIWQADKHDLCQSIIYIVNKYLRQGYRLTLRQLYYQLVAADYIPNHDTVYNKLSSILDDLRYSGQIDWDAIEDRGRIPKLPYYVEGVVDALNDTIKQYRLDRQEGQETVVEVWTEKDAISGILYKITRRYHVRLVVNKGYSSSSAMYKAYTRFAKYMNQGKKVVVLYFGDHDPSGLDMIRDINERIVSFLALGDRYHPDERHLEDWWRFYDTYKLPDEWLQAADTLIASQERNVGPQKLERAASTFFLHKHKAYIEEHGLFKVQPIGLTMEQIEQFDPPPNPAKLTDPRAKWYVKKFGEISWEVDAIEPSNMEQIVSRAIEKIIDMDLFVSVCDQEEQDVEKLVGVKSKFEEEE